MTATEVDEYAWSALGKWLKVFQALVAEPDMEWMFIDGSYAKAHPHSAGAASGKVEAIGKSQAGNTRKTGTGDCQFFCVRAGNGLPPGRP